MINHEIGANGVVSQECKAVVSQYGSTIMDLLLDEVIYTFSYNYLMENIVNSLISVEVCLLHLLRQNQRGFARKSDCVPLMEHVV